MDIPANKPSSPEEAFVLRPDLQGTGADHLPLDALTVALHRARSVLALVQTSGAGDSGFTDNHEIILNALWATEGLIDQALDMIDGSLYKRS